MSPKLKQRSAAPKPKSKPDLEIDEDEQWRLINESGILSKITPPNATTQAADRGSTSTTTGAVTVTEYSFCDELLSAALLVIPFSTLLVIMEILIHQQYGKTPRLSTLIDRLGPGIPILSVFIFYTNRHKHDWKTQLLLFLIANIGGPRMIWLFNRGSWKVNMVQCPPLATLWIYSIVQLDLGRAVLNLIIVAIWMWWKGMKYSVG